MCITSDSALLVMFMYKYKEFDFGFILLSMYQEIDIQLITRTTRSGQIKDWKAVLGHDA